MQKNNIAAHVLNSTEDVSVSNTIDENDKAGNDSNASQLTHIQYQQLMSLLNQSTPSTNAADPPQSGRIFSMCSSMTTIYVASCHTSNDCI